MDYTSKDPLEVVEQWLNISDAQYKSSVGTALSDPAVFRVQSSMLTLAGIYNRQCQPAGSALCMRNKASWAPNSLLSSWP